jgi:GTP-binding protein Era
MIAAPLKLKVPAIILLNKTDTVKDKSTIPAIVKQYEEKYKGWTVLPVSAKKQTNTDKILPLVLQLLPEGMPFYPDDSISDRNERFFVAEMVREQIYALYDEEIPYHSAVLIQAFEEKTTLTVIKADIIVSRETQKMILLGKGGSMIKQLGINARKAIEEFLQRKVHLELFVKVRPKWRDNENYLREYGYN